MAEKGVKSPNVKVGLSRKSDPSLTPKKNMDIELDVPSISGPEADVKVNVLGPDRTPLMSSFEVLSKKIKLHFSSSQSGVHVAEVYLNSKKITEFEIEVRLAPPSKAINVELLIQEVSDPSDMKVNIVDPSGNSLQNTFELKGNKLLLTFTPLQGGKHLAEVNCGNSKLLAFEIELNLMPTPEQTQATSVPKAEVSLTSGSAPKRKYKKMDFEFKIPSNIPANPKPKIVVKDPAGRIVFCNFEIRQPNIYLHFIPTLDGTHIVELQVNNNKVAEYKLEIDLDAPANQQKISQTIVEKAI